MGGMDRIDGIDGMDGMDEYAWIWMDTDGNGLTKCVDGMEWIEEME